jgi:acetyl esterase/lipase
LLVRKVFARSGEELAAALAPLAPDDVVSVIDERYDAHPDAVLDVYTPGAARGASTLPTVVWTHGGGFVGGSKEELRVYLQLLAADG